MTKQDAAVAVKKYGKKFCEAVGIKQADQFTQQMHNSLLISILAAEGLIEKENKDAIGAFLNFSGLGGNASQFKQWLVKEEIVTAKTTAAQITEALIVDLE